jgi:hypothetical protein
MRGQQCQPIYRIFDDHRRDCIEKTIAQTIIESRDFVPNKNFTILPEYYVENHGHRFINCVCHCVAGWFRNESEFIQKLVKDKIITAAKALNLAFRYIDDVQSINN